MENGEERLSSNFAFLRAVCEEFRRLKQSHGMRSLTMSEAAAAARGKEH